MRGGDDPVGWGAAEGAEGDAQGVDDTGGGAATTGDEVTTGGSTVKGVPLGPRGTDDVRETGGCGGRPAIGDTAIIDGAEGNAEELFTTAA